MKKKITIVTPVFNDWDCVKYLINDISKTLENKVDAIHLVAVNDCSSESPSNAFEIPSNMTFEQVDLVTNVGHQRAILIGLCYCLEQQFDSDYIVVMDSDGEDNPKFIGHFLNEVQASDQDKVFFAKRSKRSENWSFRFFYILYKLAFRLLTGTSISFGNFSCIPKSLLPRICNSPDFWNHYSASMIKSKVPYNLIPTERGKRYTGTSKMNVNSLLLHGFSSLSVYIESIIIRVLKLSFIIFLFLAFATGLVIYTKYFTLYAIPGWTTFVFGFILNLLITIGLFNLLMILSHLNNRNKPISRPLDFYKTLIVK